MERINEKNIQTIEVTGNTVDGDSKFGALKKLIRFKYNQVHFNLTPLGIFYSGKSRVYLIFRGRDYGSTANDLYLGAFSVSKNKFTIFRWVTNLSSVQDTSEVIGAEVYNTTEQEIFWYILTNNGIYTLKVDTQSFYGNLTQREGFKVGLENTKDTTMCVVSRNPLLAGGSLGALRGKYIAYLCDSVNVYYRYLYLSFERYNPIVIPHHNKIYFIGGNISTNENDGFMEFNRVTLFDRSRLFYGLSLYTGYEIRQEVIYPRGFDKEIRLNINNIEATAALYREEIYFFTKKTFSFRGARFYRYNTVTHEWIMYQLDTDVEKSIAIDKIASIKSVNVNNMIYIFLMGYNLVSSDKSNENTFQIEVYKFKPFF